MFETAGVKRSNEGMEAIVSHRFGLMIEERGCGLALLTIGYCNPHERAAAPLQGRRTLRRRAIAGTDHRDRNRGTRDSRPQSHGSRLRSESRRAIANTESGFAADTRSGGGTAKISSSIN